MLDLFDEVISVRLLDTAFRSQHFPELFSGEGTHDAACAFVAQLAGVTCNGDFVTAIVQSGLPDDYSGDTLAEIPGMLRSALAKFPQTEASAKSDKLQSMSSAAVTLATSIASELFHDVRRNTFLSFNTAEGGERTISLGSGTAKDWLSGTWYSTTGSALPVKARDDALATLHANALYGGAEKSVSVRISRAADAIYLDLGSADGAVVHMTADRWQVEHRSPVKFIRPATLLELPTPEAGGELSHFENLLGLEKSAASLALAFIIGALRGSGPFFCLLVDGEQGSGKSVLCSMLKKIIDPGLIDKLPLPGSDDQLFIQAKDSHVLVFDNASGMRNDMSDALCRLATGGAVAKRALYTNDDLHVLVQCNPFIINGIGDFANRPDLLERAILLSLPAMEEDRRLTEQELSAALGATLPGLLGRLFDVVCVALRDEAKTPIPRGIRMADAARWISAAEPATGLPTGTLLKAIEHSQTLSLIDRIRENSLFRSLEQLLELQGKFDGLVGALHDTLMINIDRPDRSFPRTASHLSTQLQRLRPAMAKAGIIVDLKHKGRDGRSVSIRRADGATTPTKKAKPPY
jgi:hypothetical protein